MKVIARHFFLMLRTVERVRGSLLSVLGSDSLSSRREVSDVRSLLSVPCSRESDEAALKSDTATASPRRRAGPLKRREAERAAHGVGDWPT